MDEIIEVVTREINRTLRSLRTEMHHPGASPDDNDDNIESLTHKIKVLRETRVVIEDLMAR